MNADTKDLDLLNLIAETIAERVSTRVLADIRAELSLATAAMAAGDRWAVTVPEAAKLLSISDDTLRSYTYERDEIDGIPILRYGRAVRISKVAILQRLAWKGDRDDPGRASLAGRFWSGLRRRAPLPQAQ